MLQPNVLELVGTFAGLVVAFGVPRPDDVVAAEEDLVQGDTTDEALHRLFDAVLNEVLAAEIAVLAQGGPFALGLALLTDEVLGDGRLDILLQQLDRHLAFARRQQVALEVYLQDECGKVDLV